MPTTIGFGSVGNPRRVIFSYRGANTFVPKCTYLKIVVVGVCVFSWMCLESHATTVKLIKVKIPISTSKTSPWLILLCYWPQKENSNLILRIDSKNRITKPCFRQIFFANGITDNRWVPSREPKISKSS